MGGECGGRGLEEHLPEGEISANNLQHISEREPEDWDSDPSLHPCAGTIFMERSKQAIESKPGPFFLQLIVIFNILWDAPIQRQRSTLNACNATSINFFHRWNGEKEKSAPNSRHEDVEEE